MMNQNQRGMGGLSHFLELSCRLFAILGVGVVCGLPWLLKAYLSYKGMPGGGRLYWSMLLILYVSGVCAVVILSYGAEILRRIYQQDPFTVDNARRIRRIGQWCLPVAAVYLLGTLLIPSALVLLVGLAFSFLGLLITVLCELFYQAVRYKQENDLTI